MNTPEDYIKHIIIDFFSSLRDFCRESRKADPDLKEIAAILLDVILVEIEDCIPPTTQRERLYESMQIRFVLLLQDHDRKWVWDTLQKFSGHFPETMLN